MASLPERRNERQNPFQMMSQMQRQIDRMFEDFMTGKDWSMNLPSIAENAFQPPCDLQETETHYLLSFDVPGMKKDDLKVELHDNVLHVHGERKDERENKSGSQYRSEVYYGTVERSIALPKNVKTDGIETQFENGVLHIAVPKVEAVQPKKIPVNEGKSSIISRLLGKKDQRAA